MPRRRNPLRKAILAPRITPQCQQCRKASYPSRERADAVKLRREKNRPHRTYECPAGNGWHVTQAGAS